MVGQRERPRGHDHDGGHHPRPAGVSLAWRATAQGRGQVASALAQFRAGGWPASPGLRFGHGGVSVLLPSARVPEHLQRSRRRPWVPMTRAGSAQQLLAFLSLGTRATSWWTCACAHRRGRSRRSRVPGDRQRARHPLRRRHAHRSLRPGRGRQAVRRPRPRQPDHPLLRLRPGPGRGAAGALLQGRGRRAFPLPERGHPQRGRRHRRRADLIEQPFLLAPKWPWAWPCCLPSSHHCLASFFGRVRAATAAAGAAAASTRRSSPFHLACAAGGPG